MTTRTGFDRIGDLRDLTDDQRYAMLAWLAHYRPEVFEEALAVGRKA